MSQYYWKMCGESILSFHHTFEDIVNSLNCYNFYVEKLYECCPSKEVKDKFKDYNFTSKYPNFCVFKARKITKFP